MSQQEVHGRLSLIETTRMICHVPDASAPSGWTTKEGVRVKLFPVQGEPFGTATPGGEISLILADAHAAHLFSSVPLNQEFDLILRPAL